MGDPIRLVPKDGGDAIDVPADQAAGLLQSGNFRVETGADVAQRAGVNAQHDVYGNAAAKVVAGVAGFARGATFGLSDVALTAAGGQEKLAKLKEENPYTSLGGEVVGALATEHLPGMSVAGRLAARAGEVAADASTITKIARAGAKTAVEGGFQGAGQGISELALSGQPVDFEHAASVIGSNALFGAATGGVLGAVGKGTELGLAKAKSALDKIAAEGVQKGGDVAGDLATLDRKGLRTAEKTELDAIEAARVPQRAQVADDIQQFRKELKENKLWLATKGAEESDIRAIGKRTLKADRTLDSLLDDPKALAENPKSTLSALRKQEAALDDLVNKHAPSLREKFAADTSGERAKALDYAQTALERNRSLQTKITELTSKPASERLEQIQAAVDKLNAPKLPVEAPGFGGVAGDFALGHVLGAAAGIPYVGPALAAGKMAAGVIKKLGINTAAAAERASKAVSTFLDVTKKVTPHAPIIATKILASTRYASPDKQERAPRVKQQGSAKRVLLADAFKARADELRSQVIPGPDGSMQMHPPARERMAKQLAPIAAINPVLADRIETIKARSVSFLASKLPKKPDIVGMQLGPDTWKPSDMEMRQFTRYMHAVEDPQGVIERLATGTVSPEDAEALKAVYPEMHAQATAQIMGELATLKRPLPFARRLSLSILTGVAVDPALDPRILNVLQATYAREEGTDEGAQAPRAQPQFGSVTKPDPTPAQKREAG